MKTIAIAGTFDTQGKEFLYVKQLVEELGLKTLMIHTGVFKPAFSVDITNVEVASFRIRYRGNSKKKRSCISDRSFV